MCHSILKIVVLLNLSRLIYPAKTFILTFSLLKFNIVRKGVPASFLKSQPLERACPPPPHLFLKFLFPLPSFLFHPLLKYFGQFLTTRRQPSCSNPTRQLSLRIHTVSFLDNLERLFSLDYGGRKKFTLSITQFCKE